MVIECMWISLCLSDILNIFVRFRTTITGISLPQQKLSKLTIIDLDNGLSPGRRQAIIWTNAGILLIRILETNLSEISSAIHTFSYKKMHLKMSSGKWRPFCLGLNVLMVEWFWPNVRVVYMMI